MAWSSLELNYVPEQCVCKVYIKEKNSLNDFSVVVHSWYKTVLLLSYINCTPLRPILKGNTGTKTTEGKMSGTNLQKESGSALDRARNKFHTGLQGEIPVLEVLPIPGAGQFSAHPPPALAKALGGLGGSKTQWCQAMGLVQSSCKSVTVRASRCELTVGKALNLLKWRFSCLCLMEGAGFGCILQIFCLACWQQAVGFSR